MSGFIDDYYFDIGDEVKNGQLLAKIFVPELKERHDQMVEQVKLDTQLVDVAQKGVQNAEAEVAEAKAKLRSYDAEIDRWGTEVKRLTEMVREKVVDQEILTETKMTLDQSVAAKNAANATVNAGGGPGDVQSQPGQGRHPGQSRRRRGAHLPGNAGLHPDHRAL